MGTNLNDRQVPRELRQFPTWSILLKRLFSVLAELRKMMLTLLNVEMHGQVLFQRPPRKILTWPLAGPGSPKAPILEVNNQKAVTFSRRMLR